MDEWSIDGIFVKEKLPKRNRAILLEKFREIELRFQVNFDPHSEHSLRTLAPNKSNSVPMNIGDQTWLIFWYYNHGSLIVTTQETTGIVNLYWSKDFIGCPMVYYITWYLAWTHTRKLNKRSCLSHDFNLAWKSRKLACAAFLCDTELLKDQNLHSKLQSYSKLRIFTNFEPSLPIQSFRGFWHQKSSVGQPFVTAT